MGEATSLPGDWMTGFHSWWLSMFCWRATPDRCCLNTTVQRSRLRPNQSWPGGYLARAGALQAGGYPRRQIRVYVIYDLGF